MFRFGFLLLSLLASSRSEENCKSGGTEDCASLQGSTSRDLDQATDWSKATSIYQFRANDINGTEVNLEKYRGRVLLVVNVASQCGLTENNYKQLEALYEKYGESKGLGILAFPSNQFATQEPGTSAEILEFVKRYNVQFDLFEKVNVNGDSAHPLWKWLKKHGSGFLTDDIKWNFTKFLINKEGQVVDRFAPTTEPLSIEDKLNSYF